MPPLSRPETGHKISFSSEALLAAKTDVLVVGAGPAGIGAALGAARAGANVVLQGIMQVSGGAATVALVMPLMSAHTQEAFPGVPGKLLYIHRSRGKIKR